MLVGLPCKHSEVIELAKYFPNIVPQSQLSELKSNSVHLLSLEKKLTSLTAYWHKVSLVKDRAGGPRIPLLTMLAAVILTINRSNVDSECLFLH